MNRLVVAGLVAWMFATPPQSGEHKPTAGDLAAAAVAQYLSSLAESGHGTSIDAYLAALGLNHAEDLVGSPRRQLIASAILTRSRRNLRSELGRARADSETEFSRPPIDANDLDSPIMFDPFQADLGQNLCGPMEGEGANVEHYGYIIANVAPALYALEGYEDSTERDSIPKLPHTIDSLAFKRALNVDARLQCNHIPLDRLSPVGVGVDPAHSRYSRYVYVAKEMDGVPHIDTVSVWFNASSLQLLDRLRRWRNSYDTTHRESNLKDKPSRIAFPPFGESSDHRVYLVSAVAIVEDAFDEHHCRRVMLRYSSQLCKDNHCRTPGDPQHRIRGDPQLVTVFQSGFAHRLKCPGH